MRNEKCFAALVDTTIANPDVAGPPALEFGMAEMDLRRINQINGVSVFIKPR